MLTTLFVPGDRPDRFAKAVDSGADSVIIDLEDAVAPARKDYARSAAAEFCAGPTRVPVYVRINALDGPLAAADLDALADRSGLAGLRLPKVDSPDQVRRLADAFPGPLFCLIESALGLERAYEIGTAHPRVAGIGLGEADLRADLNVPDESGLGYARGRIVAAARAAGLPPPPMSVYPDVSDVDGLAASCRAGRALGFLGRAAIHPRQLPVIVAAFRPAPDEVARARELLDALAEADAAGSGTAVLGDGRFADRAMGPAARRIVELAMRYPT